ncbi:unnamed protein product [Prunus armeniaca]|uniref:RRM domain-containing protein n=1 Tax=Prunus armeniaca TaxID=36596 RepID=A0A6J5VDD8_PRUAR|nr:unnamed protein product [Prunus armeniaca]
MKDREIGRSRCFGFVTFSNDKDMRNGIQGCQSLNLRVTMGTTWKPTSPLSIKITMTDLHHYTN